MAEQAAELYIRSAILQLTGEMPRTHSLRRLLGILHQILEEKKDEIERIVRDNGKLIALLEDDISVRDICPELTAKRKPRISYHLRRR